MIEVKNINKSFDGNQVLFDISGIFENGKCNLIIGESGSGKTVHFDSVTDHEKLVHRMRLFQAELEERR